MILKQLIDRASDFSPRVLPNNDLARAAVLLAVTDHPEDPEIILTQRSNELPTHKGEVAFPGGKVETFDQSIVSAALREAYEEIGLDPKLVEVITLLDQVVSRYGFLVTPILGVVPHNVKLIAEPGEIANIFRVPVSFFIDKKPHQIDQLGSFKGPRWYYDDYTIWGLTAMMLGEFLNHFLEQDIEISLGDFHELLSS